MVTELPTVTEEMLMGTVPLIDAVTEPIWAVPATSAGSEPMVTVPKMGIGFPAETAAPDPVPMKILAGTGFVA
jgi:hypothetical protein